jgi:hypothetical protein
MRRSIVVRVEVAVMVAVAICGSFGRASAAGGPGGVAQASCTNDEAHDGQGYGQARVATRACGPQGCGPHGCGARAHCRGPGCHGGCGHRHCCPGPCCHGLCEQIGHCLHHDVYEKRYFLRSQGKSWHSTWYDPAEGRPIALVVPPTAEFQAQYGWGVPSSRVAPIYHQFRRPYPGPGAVGGSGGGFLPTPRMPSDTVQFGVNAVRGPWGAY